ncbi:MAG: restriction endonuclease [Nitrosopumilaceae archaeon]|nr:restriction endonuclease [Nitrosopumilaceae archaeon]
MKECSPYFFKQIVTELLERMGYGIGKTTKKSHDGGIDGIITADKLGLSELYIQAKRFSNTVPTSYVKEFIGTIQTTKTKTGVFITSGIIASNANDFILKSGLNIQLVDGEKLSDLLYEYDIGLEVKIKPIKYIDEHFFEEEVIPSKTPREYELYYNRPYDY